MGSRRVFDVELFHPGRLIGDISFGHQLNFNLDFDHMRVQILAMVYRCRIVFICGTFAVLAAAGFQFFEPSFLSRCNKIVVKGIVCSADIWQCSKC